MKTMRYSLVSTVFLLLLVSCGGGGGDSLSQNTCGLVGLSTRIINGAACQEGTSPIVRLEIDTPQGIALCSGTLLTTHDVLTAAHCFFEGAISARVVVGSQVSNVSAVILHPGTSVSQKNLAVFNDAAIVRLAAPIATQILPIVRSRQIVVGDLFSIYGYGLDENGKTHALRGGQMRASAVTDNHIFAGFSGSGSNTCNGDSGGPAVFNFRDSKGELVNGIVGLVSSGENLDCSEGDTSLFANAQADSIFDFVLEHVPGTKVI